MWTVQFTRCTLMHHKRSVGGESPVVRPWQCVVSSGLVNRSKQLDLQQEGYRRFQSVSLVQSEQQNVPCG